MSIVVSRLSGITTASLVTVSFYTTAELVSCVTGGEIQIGDVKQDWIQWATEEVERHTGMKFRSTSFTDTLNGNGLATIFTRCFPVNDINQVKVDEVILDPTVYCVNPRTGSVTLKDGIFSEGICNVIVNGSTGIVPLPPLIEKIATLLVAKTALKTKCGSLVDSESIGGFNQSRSLKKVNDELDRAWKAWGKRFEFGFV